MFHTFKWGSETAPEMATQLSSCLYQGKTAVENKRREKIFDCCIQCSFSPQMLL